MRTVVHLSDLHFDRVEHDVVDALADTVVALAPNVVAVSGDLTQRARAAQFRHARAFLDRLPAPQIVVPGNHDVPLYNVVARTLSPLGGYLRHVTTDLNPGYTDDELVMIGVNTTRSLTVKGGAIRDDDVPRIIDRAKQSGDAAMIVVCHHPFDLPGGSPDARRRRSSRQTIDLFAQAGVDVFLTGHLHISSTAHSAERYGTRTRSVIVVEGGTATSTRVRGEDNSFNVLRLDRTTIFVERLEWRGTERRFVVVDVQEFDRTPDGWLPAGRQ